MSNPFSVLGSEPDDKPERKIAFPPSDIERTLLVKSEAFVYKIPPQTKAAGWKANDWNLDKPDWKGKLRLTARGKTAEIKLVESSSGKLYAACQIETYPGPAVQSVADSSRYFVIKVVEGEKTAYLGLGFADRADSFDLNTHLHDHFKGILTEDRIEQEKEEPPEKLDLALKEGETIKVSINIPRKNRTKSPGSRAGAGAGMSLPKPPGPAGALPAPPSPALAKLNISRRPPPAAPGGSTNWIQF